MSDKHIGRYIALIAGGAAGAAILVHLITPKPGTLAARQIMKLPDYEDPDDLAETAVKTTMHADLDYGSALPNGRLDIYEPIRHPDESKPVVFWLHGGGYIGGSRKVSAPFCTMLAARGLVVVNVDYALAPEVTYPVMQLGDAYRFVRENADLFHADMSRIAFGGDGAGGQIVGQFVNAQVNKEYSQEAAIVPTVEPATIKAVAFMCAPFNMRRFDYLSDRDGAPALKPTRLFGRFAWTYFGSRSWRTSDEVKLASLLDTVDSNFPATYITDGAVLSYNPQPSQMASQLKLLGVEVESYIPHLDAGSSELRKITHGYQYHFDLPQASRNFELCASFFKRHLYNNPNA
jgi:acetyl esterase/lipase